MFRFKNAASIAVTLMMSMGMTLAAFADENNQRTIAEQNMTPDKTIIAAYQPISRSSSLVTVDHSYGVDWEEVGSTAYKERAWGVTHHYIKNYSEPDTPVDGYTRARWELGDLMKADSGRCWDSDDGMIHGRSSATSPWVLENYLYIAHTYYGN